MESKLSVITPEPLSSISPFATKALVKSASFFVRTSTPRVTYCDPEVASVGLSMAALASGEPWPSSGGMMHCTKFLLKWCAAALIVHCNKDQNIEESS